MTKHVCTKENVLSKLEVHAAYHTVMLEKLDKKTDNLVGKRELAIYRWIMGGICVSILTIITFLLEKTYGS